MSTYSHPWALASILRSRVPKNLTLFLTMTILLISVLTGPVFASNSGFNIGGYDPVSFFDPAGPKLGSNDLIIEHDGAKYVFHNKQNADTFRLNPGKYAPQFGGNCAFGMVFGSKSTVDPKIWKVVGGKLYFHINAGTQLTWSKKQDAYIERAEVAWQSIK